ncbi:LOW QUALITY PROTEIN: hydroperoxide isomerase ALOXE3-like, partial [Cyrtonyx montezumae]|uniref:LOW QUALITY PROTEIN: hydroperoxide isomerase ALOXE3-like n=1 Tax=Cyrtonyx montezumae TaxID=9017 RepID=UPI0032DB2687
VSEPRPTAALFTPSDAPWRWVLAKLWVRSAHFLQHEMVEHLLLTHFIAEAFAVATEHLPACHPPAQGLLRPHFRYTFHINILARDTLLNPGGIIDQATSIGRAGTLQLLERGTAAVTYAQLCVPDDIAARGVAQIPHYHYRDDATDIWGAIHRFVHGIVALYYPSDAAVCDDPEVQLWVHEIFTRAVLGNHRSGFPTKLCSRPELVKFVTMIIFRCSAQHSAVNSGQFDFAAWMPNAPGTMRRAPPRAGDEVTERTVLDALPSPAATGALRALLSVVSYEVGERRPLGCYPEEHFTEAAPQRLMAQFRRRLHCISRRIRRRNAALPLPYPYLDPQRVEKQHLHLSRRPAALRGTPRHLRSRPQKLFFLR